VRFKRRGGGIFAGFGGVEGVLGGVDVDAGVAGNSYAGSVVGMNGRSWEVSRGEGEVIAGMLAVFPAIGFSFVYVNSMDSRHPGSHPDPTPHGYL